jgi:hypothetical protein
MSLSTLPEKTPDPIPLKRIVRIFPAITRIATDENGIDTAKTLMALKSVARLSVFFHAKSVFGPCLNRGCFLADQIA